LHASVPELGLDHLPMTTKTLNTAELEGEISYQISQYYDDNGSGSPAPSVQEVIDRLCDDLRKERIRFDEPTARKLIAAKVSR
jgi:hypothetical protein